MRLGIKTLAPMAIVAIAAGIAAAIVAARPSPESTRPPVATPLVRIVRAYPAPVALRVEAHGTVEPRTESDLVAEIAGRIIAISPQLAVGGFFDTGEVLATIDPRDYEIALEGARAAVARVENDLVHARSSLERQKSMRQSGASSRQRLDDAIHAEANARAGVREARVSVRRAELDLERTEIRALFSGRVREKHVDVGQYVTRGAPIARIYSIDYAEVRLPITDADLAYLDLPVATRPTDGAEANTAEPRGPDVELSAEYAGARYTWSGYVVRTEGALDPRTRMLNIVARVDDPYGREGDATHPPLPIGLFVEASIEGRHVENIYELPRAALRRNAEVFVVDEEDHLRVRPVEVLRSGRRRAWVRAGLEPGERVIVSALEVVMEGMKVRTTESVAEDASSQSFFPVDRESPTETATGAPS